MAAKKLDVLEENVTIIQLNSNTCKGCEGKLFCEHAYLNCKACITMPELFVSQR